MSVIERFTTMSVAPAKRLGFWNDLANQTFTGLAVDSPANTESFSAEMLRWSLDSLTMIRPKSQAAVVHRWAQGSETPIDRVILHMQHSGHCENSQWNRVAALSGGDFSLCHSRDHYRLNLSERNDMLVVEMPAAALAERIPHFEDKICKSISGSSPAARLLHDFLLSLWRQGDQSGADPLWQQGVANVLLDLLAVAVRGADLLVSASSSVKDRVLALIESRLCDPELKTGTIAAELGISARSVQNVFAAMATTPSFYILERRLSRAAERLIDPAAVNITEIAFEAGFNDSAYFTRCFRNRYGTTPTNWRSMH